MIATKNVTGYLAPYTSILSKPQFHHLQTITLGMFTEGKKSLLAISKRVLGSKSQSSLNDFLNESPWKEKDLNDLRLKMLNNDTKFRISSKGFFVIDDCLVEEFGKKMEGVGKHFDHTDNKYKKARIIVTLFYIEGDYSYPVDARPYYKQEEVGELDFKTKNELALEMIEEHLPENEADYPICLFDSWFSGTEFLKSLDERNIGFVTRAKSNRNFYYEGAKFKPAELFEHTGLDILKAEVEGWNKALTLAKGEEREYSQDKDPNFFLISNIDANFAKELQDYYDYRWPIEPMFKDMKQLFGWTDLSFKSSLATLRIIYLSFVAYTIAAKEQAKQKFNATIGEICDFFRKLSLKELIKKAFAFSKRNVTLSAVLNSFGF